MPHPTSVPSIPRRTGVRMFIASVVTLLVLLALLGFAINVLFAEGFLARPPQGERAMALVIPILGSVGAGVVFVLAGVLCAVQARATVGALLHASPAVGGWVVVLVTIGATLLAVLSFMLWVEPMSVDIRLKGLTVVVGWLGGILGPLLVAAFLLAGVWLAPGRAIEDAAARAILLGVVVMLGALSLTGYAMAATGARTLLSERAKVRAAVSQERAERDEKWEAHNALPQTQRVAAELAGMADASPLWPIAVYLAPTPDQERLTDETRRLIVARALKVPDLDAEMLRTMQARYALYRLGAAELIVHTPDDAFAEHQAAWAAALVAGIDTVAERVACRPAWLSETFDLNPDPLGHVQTLLAAAERFSGGPHHAQIDVAFKRLAAATSTLTRDGELERLAEVLGRAGHPIPD